MSGERLRIVAAAGLVIGALLGMAGTFAPSAELRGLAWGIDGTPLIVACALLVVHHLRQGNGQLAAGFLVFLAGETLIVSGSAMELAARAPTVAAGFGGAAMTPLSRPLPFFAYPFLAITLFRMGLGAREIKSELRSGAAQSAPACRWGMTAAVSLVRFLARCIVGMDSALTVIRRFRGAP